MGSVLDWLEARSWQPQARSTLRALLLNQHPVEYSRNEYFLTAPLRNKLLIIAILGALSTVSPFAIDMYLPAISQIAQELSTTPARVSMSISSYFIGLGEGQLFYGPLLDRLWR